MKKFLKKRPPEPANVASTRLPRNLANNPGSSSLGEASFDGFPLSGVDEMRNRMDSLAMENSKMKSALQNLTEENIRLQDQIRHSSVVVTRVDDARIDQTPSSKMDEIQKLVQVIIEENDHLTKRLQIERDQAYESGKIYETQIQRLTAEYERCQLENVRLRQDWQMAILENDDLRLRASVMASEQSAKQYDDEIGTRSSFEACRTLLDELKRKYKEELNRIQGALEKSTDEKRTLGLRLAQVEADAEIANKRQTEFWESAKLLESENKKLSALLESKDERVRKVEIMFNELLNVAKEMANSKAKGEKAWIENRQEMMSKLQKLERKCQTLKDDNEKLKSFKHEAVSKLIEARKLLLLDS